MVVTPPILLNQFRLWQNNAAPMGFASWTFFGEEQEERIVKQGIRRVMPTDWKSGETLWRIDFVAPMGGQEAMLKELREKTLAGQKMKMLQPSPDGSVGLVEW
jgi:cytolysin-activating lysine-acyltransferase